MKLTLCVQVYVALLQLFWPRRPNPLIIISTLALIVLVPFFLPQAHHVYMIDLVCL